MTAIATDIADTDDRTGKIQRDYSCMCGAGYEVTSVNSTACASDREQLGHNECAKQCKTDSTCNDTVIYGHTLGGSWCEGNSWHFHRTGTDLNNGNNTTKYQVKYHGADLMKTGLAASSKWKTKSDQGHTFLIQNAITSSLTSDTTRIRMSSDSVVSRPWCKGP